MSVKFEKLYITGFGELRELEFPEISPGLNIIEGANEAGKTTLLEFVRALFFGFAQRDKNSDDARRYVPKEGGPHGGWAIVNNSHGDQLRIERVGDKSSAGACNVQLLGTSREMNLDAVLSGAGRTLYEQVFAFSLDELTGFSNSDQRVQNRIYAASSGRQGDFLLAALKRTGDAAKDIYLKSGRNPLLNKALTEYRELQEEIRKQSGQVENYNSDRDRFLEQQQDAAALREEFRIAKEQLRIAELHHTVWPTWVRLSALRRELEELPLQPEFDGNKASLMPALKVQLRQCEEKLEEVRPRLERVVNELKNREVDNAILQNAAAIKSVKERLGAYEAAIGELPLQQQKLRDIQRQIDDHLEQLGPQWDETRLEMMDTSREPRLQIQQFEQKLEGQRKILEEAIQTGAAVARQLEQQQQSLQRLSAEIHREFTSPPPSSEILTQRVAALRIAGELLRKEETENFRAGYLREEIKEKQDQQNENRHEAHSATSLPLKWALAPVVFGLLAGVLLRQQPLLAVLAAACFVALSGILIAVSRIQAQNLMLQKEQETQRRQQAELAVSRLHENLQRCENAMREMHAQLQKIEQEFAWDLKTSTDHQKLSMQLQQDRENHVRYETRQQELKRRSADGEALAETQKEQLEKIASLKSAFEEQQARWNHWLRERNLPENNAPRQTLELFDFIQNRREELRSRNQCRMEIAAKEEQCRRFDEETALLWQVLQRVAPQPKEVPSAVRALNEEWEEQQKRNIERTNLLKNLQQLQDDESVQQAKREATAQQIQELLANAGCADQNEFNHKAENANRRCELQRQCEEQLRILETHSAPGEKCLEVEKALENLDAQQVQERWETAQAAYTRSEETLSQAERGLGEWNHKIQQLEKDEGQLTSLLRRREILKTRIADLTEEWAVARVANVMLDCTRARFEKERQPAVIKRAGELMRDVTAGRYQTVLAAGELNAVELDEGERGRKPLSRWSRGTKEQFYLALRLAFIEDYCSVEHLEPLPVVMDDVLVHADGYHRLAAASTMIAEFAKNHQVLYFTCRPGDADVLCEVAPEARRYRLQQGKFVAIVE